MNSILKAVAAVVFVFLMSQMCDCASSNLVNIWQDASFQAPPLGKMLVIAIRKNATRRHIWEDAFAGELTKYGVAATTSYSLFPNAPPDTSQVIAAVQANGFDGVLVILRLPTETDTHYVQAYTAIEQVRGSYNSDLPRYGSYSPYYNIYYYTYWQRYGTYYLEIEHPGYIETQTIAMSAIDVTTTGNGGRLIWSATSRTPDPGYVKDIQQGIVGLVISELAQRRIISSKK